MMILDPYSALPSNVCENQLKAKPSEEQLLQTRRSQTNAGSKLTSLNSVCDRLIMDNVSPSRSPLTTASDEEGDNVSTKSKDEPAHHSPTAATSEDTALVKKEEDDDESKQVDNHSNKSSTLTDDEDDDKMMARAGQKMTNNVTNSEISQLQSHMQRLESTIETSVVRISQLEDTLIQKNKIIAELEERLTREMTLARLGASAVGELNPFGPAAAAALSSMADQKALEAYLLEKTKSEVPEESNHAQQLLQQRQQHLLHSLVLPQLQGLGNVNEFGTMLGEELANTYAKAIAKRDPSFLAMAAAAAATGNGKTSANNLGANNLTETLSPLNGDEMSDMDKIGTGGSASTTPTSAMICADGADPLSHSPLGATTVSDLGLRSYSPAAQHNVSYDKLQHQLRCNVERYMNENLNTLQISRCVRELLSMHNIGQRLFAKYVLGLSQGTVSELLSKPKPWDKLTEKGRDSYRKMHAWATDERCINLLKSMVPRKEYGYHLGKDATPYKHEDPVAEERIAQILSEAQRSMKLTTRAEMFSPSIFNNGGDGGGGGNSDNQSDRADSKGVVSSSFTTTPGNNDTASDNGSDRDEKLDTDCKSPVFNATALATINNFYRNFSEPFNYNDQRGPTTTHADKHSRGINNHNKFGESDEADMLKLCQNQLAKLFGAQLEEDMRVNDIRNVLALYQQVNPFVAQNNPQLLSRLFSAGLVGSGAANYLGNLPLNLDTLPEVARSVKNIDKDGSPLDNRKLQAMMAASNQMKLASLSPTPSNGSEPHSQRNNNLIGQGNNNGHSAPSISSMLSNGNEPSAEDLAASPLQRIQSITNSLLSQSSLPSLPSQPSRPTKAVLPPITQQQFDQYNNLNTEDIVKRVKEQLSQYSISQRLFGESVLGLSQGSVSDLLARPKPWHMLTQKGREPFIRMKMFLEDENAIHKLVASQYKIAPEKLMRTGSFVAGNSLPNLTGAAGLPVHISTPPSTLSIGSNNSSTKNFGLKPGPDFAMKYEQSMSPNSTENGNRSNTSSPELNISNASDLTPPPPASSMSNAAVAAAAVLRQRGLANLAGFPGAHTSQANLMRPSSVPSAQSTASSLAGQPGSYMQPSVYELAALTSDLDTQVITTRIKETLMAHNIGQKIFGEVVLGLSQGSVSELLSKPKPWHMLSIKGREPFIRMQLWLNDANNIEKLQTLKNERREANKRRRTHVDDSYNSYKAPIESQLLNFNNFNLGKSLLSSPGSLPLSTLCTPTSSQPTVKKARILFTEEQKEALKIAFAMDPYPSSTTSEFLAKELNLSIRTITNWFHNHRMRLKQINTSAMNGEESNPQSVLYNIGRDNGSFDQTYFRNILTQRLAELKTRSGHMTNNSNSNLSSNGSNAENSSNQFNFAGGQSDSSPSHRFKYSSLFNAQSLYSNNSCSSPGSTSPYQEDEEMSTLDLSMSSHNPQKQHAKQQQQSQDDLDDDSQGRAMDREDDNDDDDDDDGQQEDKVVSFAKMLGASRRKPQLVMSSSSRRKAAQPQQWRSVGGDAKKMSDDEEYEIEEDEEEDNNRNCKRMRTEDEEMNDDQKTDDDDDEEEEEEHDENGQSDSETLANSYHKLNPSKPPVMSKMKEDNNSSRVQECVQ